MRSHSVTCHPTQVNTPRLNPSQTGRYSRDGRQSWARGLVTYGDGLPCPHMVTHPSTNPAAHGRKSNLQPSC